MALEALVKGMLRMGDERFTAAGIEDELTGCRSLLDGKVCE
jgi:hypothetical protein